MKVEHPGLAPRDAAMQVLSQYPASHPKTWDVQARPASNDGEVQKQARGAALQGQRQLHAQDRWPRLIEHHAHPTTRSGRKGRA